MALSQCLYGVWNYVEARCERNRIRFAIDGVEVNRVEVTPIDGQQPLTAQAGFLFNEPGVRIRNLVVRKN